MSSSETKQVVKTTSKKGKIKLININDANDAIKNHMSRHWSEIKMIESICNEIYKKFVFSGKGDKMKRSINGSNVKFLEAGTLKDFCVALLGGQFFNWFRRTHLSHFKTKKVALRICKPKSMLARVLRWTSSHPFVPVSFYYTEIEYSSIKCGSFIPPHTDSAKKRLSFVFYLPDPSRTLNSEERLALGTVFWKPKNNIHKPLRRFDCRLLDGAERARFFEEYEPCKVASYEPNSFCGFIKTDMSWHTVNSFENDYDRRAIVINVWEL